MKKYFIILTLGLAAILLFSGNLVGGCSYYQSPHREVEEGELADYYIRVRNDDHPLGVKVRIDVNQTIGKFTVKNTEHDLNYGDVGFTYIYVRTDYPFVSQIITNYSGSEKGALDSEYTETDIGDFKTTIIHPPPSEEREAFTDGSNVFLGISISLISLAAYFVYRFKLGSLPFFKAHSQLRRDKLLKNENRHNIYRTLWENPRGMTITEMGQAVGIEHHSATEYHLARLIEFRYARRVDNLFFPSGIQVPKPIEEQIKEAMESGYRTPTAIARKIGSYRTKVKYYMLKMGLKKR